MPVSTNGEFRTFCHGKPRNAFFLLFRHLPAEGPAAKGQTRPKTNCSASQGSCREATEGFRVHETNITPTKQASHPRITWTYASVGVKPLRPSGPAPLRGGAIAAGTCRHTSSPSGGFHLAGRSGCAPHWRNRPPAQEYYHSSQPPLRFASAPDTP